MTEQTEELAALQAVVSRLERLPAAQQDKILRSAREMLELPRTDDSRIRSAWQYHQNADNIQHQRHIIFILAQTIFFTGFAASGSQPTLQWLVLALGPTFAILWWRAADSLEQRLEAMRDILKEDPVWQIYTDAACQKAIFGGRYIFNRWLPGLTFLGWMFVLVDRLCRG